MVFGLSTVLPVCDRLWRSAALSNRREKWSTPYSLRKHAIGFMVRFRVNEQQFSVV
jgi:hypothetical protein